MLPRNQRMELLARAYVHAVVAQAGCIGAIPSPDYGVDLDVHSVSEEGGTFTDEGVAFHLQLRSTMDAAYREEDDAFHYDLDVKIYNFLRKPDVKVPRYLVLFVMPKDEFAWLSQDHEGLLLRHCAYYHSLHGVAPTRNKDSVAIVIPRQQVFSVAFVERLLFPRA